MLSLTKGQANQLCQTQPLSQTNLANVTSNEGPTYQIGDWITECVSAATTAVADYVDTWKRDYE